MILKLMARAFDSWAAYVQGLAPEAVSIRAVWLLMFASFLGGLWLVTVISPILAK